MSWIVRIAALGLTLLAAPLAHAQGYPDHPVKVIVPFAPAGPTDVVARLITQKLSERLKQQFYIENIAGAGGNLGMGNAAKSAPDGYTILFVSSSYTVNTSLYAKPPYDPDKDLAPVTMAATSPNGLFVNPEHHPVEVDQGTGRAPARQSRQVHFRLTRHRHHAASVERTVQAHVRA